MIKIYCAPRGGANGSEAVYGLLDLAYRRDVGGALPAIEKTPAGKPYFPDRRDIHFSLSHAKTHVLCAISNCPVGADVESPREISARALKYFSSPEELTQFHPLDLWVLKESYIKLFGLTLISMQFLSFYREGGKITAPDPRVLSKLYSVNGCRAALCAIDADPPESIELISGSHALF